MSYRVIIADDEPKMISLIKLLGKWKEYDIEIIDECNDGRQTYESILKNKPDFVMSDIKMPEMDGLQLIEAVRKEGCDCFFILISGFRHFEYARTAISLNVMDYLLKPIDEEQLNRTLEKMCQQVRTKQEAEKEREELNQIRSEKQREEWKNFWDDMVDLREKHIRDYQTDVSENRLRSLEICNRYYHTAFFAGEFLCVRICTNISNMLGKENSLLQTTIEKFVQKNLGQRAYCCYHITQLGIILILNYKKEDRRWIREAVSSLYYRMRDMEEIYGEFRLNFGLSCAYGSVSDLITMTHEAMTAEWGRLLSMNNGILEYSQVADLPRFSRKDMVSDQEMDQLVSCVKYLRREEIGTLFGNIFQRALNHGNDFPGSMGETYYRLLWNIADAVQEKSRETVFADIYNAYVESKNYSAAIRGMYHIVDAYIVKELENAKEKNGKPIQEAVRFVQEHYASPISLDDVAAKSNVSTTYLSKLFKEELGVNFVDYLTRVRLDAAEQLLADSTLSIKDIAAAVGYPDEKYFSKLFKKTTGIKPTEYRKIYG